MNTAIRKKLDIIDDCFGKNLRLAEGQEGSFPHDSTDGIHDLLRCAEVIVDVMIRSFG